MSHLRVLSIEGAARLDVKNAGKLLKKCQHLEFPHIGGTRMDFAFGDSNVLDFVQPTARLSWLHFRFPTSLTIKGLRALGLKFPNVRALIFGRVQSMKLLELGSHGSPVFPSLQQLHVFESSSDPNFTVEAILPIVHHHMPRLVLISTGRPDIDRQIHDMLPCREDDLLTTDFKEWP